MYVIRAPEIFFTFYPASGTAFKGMYYFKKAPVKDFIILRGDTDKRNAWLKWRLSDDAIGYTIYTGVAPDKLYNNILLYGVNEYYFKAMDDKNPYYFQIEAFNENGISERTPVIKAE